MNKIELVSQPVALYKLLKFQGLVSSGGEAKHLIAEGAVTVNGEIETRKRKKLNAGDVIGFGGDEFQLILI